MPEITVEPAVVKDATCPECGGTTGLVTGFVYQDGEANSIYHLDWCEGDHPGRFAFLTITSGDWSEATAPSERITLGVEVRPQGLTLADAPRRKQPERFVPRDEALALGGLDAFWHLVDHVLVDDPATAQVMAWIGGEADTGFRAT